MPDFDNAFKTTKIEKKLLKVCVCCTKITLLFDVGDTFYAKL